MESLIWNLFKKTGNIKYYLLLRELRGNDEGDDRGDNLK